MKIEEFALERYQSIWENRVEVNLTESGIHPFTLRELLRPEQIDEILDTRLGYGWTNGAPRVRRQIAAMYPGAGEANVLVTNGSAEANFISMWSLIEPGEEIVLMLPNYMQIWGLARSLGAAVRPFHLREEDDWAPDLMELRRQVSSRTRAIVVCHPNNPTGAVLSDEEMDGIVDIAAGTGCWLYSDEVYRGAELDGRESPSFHGRYDRVIVASGLSKALSHPGLRIGWLVGPEEFIADAWSRSDYTTITTGILGQRVASFILQPETRRRILDRNRRLLNENLTVLHAWIGERQQLFHLVSPRAGGIAFVRYQMDRNSTELVEQFRREHGVLLVAGDFFGMDGYLRIGIGGGTEQLREGLARIERGL